MHVVLLKSVASKDVKSRKCALAMCYYCAESLLRTNSVTSREKFTSQGGIMCVSTTSDKRGTRQKLVHF